MSCVEDALSDKILVSNILSQLVIIVSLSLAIIALIIIIVTLGVEACIQRNSKQLLEQNVMREEAADYYLGEDTKYYTYVCDDKPDAAPPQPLPQPAGQEGDNKDKALNDLLESSKKQKPKP